MDRQDLAGMIDHTVLGPETTSEDVQQVIAEAKDHGMNACIPPCYLGEAASVSDITTATVVGFPHGQHATVSKADEAANAAAAGADEIDMVANWGRLRAGGIAAVTEDIAAVVDAVDLPVKVIVEAPQLTETELEHACEAAVEAGADMVKTATGFADGGAVVSDVAVMSEYLPVKASGGIGSYEEAVQMIDAGAQRIGASRGVDILDGAPR
jgi:deoxyribose-phosphate aldolase